MALLYLITIKNKKKSYALSSRAKDKITAVIKIKYKAWPKPSSETTRIEIIHCCFINFKRGGGGVRGQ